MLAFYLVSPSIDWKQFYMKFPKFHFKGGREMKILIVHKGYDWLLHVTDYDYEPAEKGVQPSLTNPGEPSYPESASITEGYLQLDGEGMLAIRINKQLYERGDGALFNMLIELYQDDFIDHLLDAIHEQEEEYDDLPLRIETTKTITGFL